MDELAEGSRTVGAEARVTRGPRNIRPSMVRSSVVLSMREKLQEPEGWLISGTRENEYE